MATISKIYDAIATKKFACSISLSEVNEKAEIEITKIAETIDIKGFRKGHVPIKMVKEMYFSKAYNTAADAMIRETIENIAKENDFKLAASPSVKLNEEEKEAVSFEITFELMPIVPENFDFSAIKATTYEVDLTPEELESELQLIANKNKTFSTKEGKAELGDIVVIDAIGRVDGVEFAGGKLEGHELELGSGAFIPGFEAQLVGQGSGENTVVTVTFPTDYHAKDLAGKEAQFFTKVTEVKKSEKAELNDELAKKLSFENVEALKVQVSSRIHEFYKNSHKESLKEEIFENLSKLLTFEISEGMVEKVMHNLAEEKKVPVEEVETLKDEATQRLRLSFFLNFLADKENISVSQQDFTNFIIQSGTDSGMNPFAMLEFYNKNKEARKRLEALLEENKIFNFIFEKITVSSEKISKQKFDEILNIKK
jgi:trigger factor